MCDRRFLVFLIGSIVAATALPAAERPNILIAISDDQSYPHTSAYASPGVETPAFDRVAQSGVLFSQAFTPAPGCSPMRAAFLTGREIWQLAAAGTHASSFPRDLPVFTDQLAEAGYHVGMTGKGWGPGNFKISGWSRNPAGKNYGAHKQPAPDGISNNDYATNFEDFLDDRSGEQPFCFWFGAAEPHRSYKPGIGAAEGIDPSEITVPAFLPDCDVVRNDLADYLFEIEWFDAQLARMLDLLAERGELDNTLVIVTSDNGMPFPRAKANLYEYGIHMPLAIAWPERIPAGQRNDDLVSLIDVTATIFAAAEVEPRNADVMPGSELLTRLSGGNGTPRSAVFSGRERHSSSRYNSLGYPCRAIRTATHLYIRNFTPERWPAGAPQKYADVTYADPSTIETSRLGPEQGGYHDIDDGPTLQWMIEHQDEPAVGRLLHAAVDRRAAEELYDIQADPACLNNLAGVEKHQPLKQQLAEQLTEYLVRTGDLRETDPIGAEVWETYERFSPLRWFPVPEWVSRQTATRPEQPWLEARRPLAREDRGED